MTTLTRKQAETLKEIRRFIELHGYAPSVRELATILNRGTATVHYHLVMLAEKRRIKLTGEHHGIIVL
jgi:SOS-response transcriptional repressor LexA